MAKREHRRHLLGGTWPHDAQRLAMKETARLAQESFHASRVRDNVIFAGDDFEARDDAGEGFFMSGWRIQGENHVPSLQKA